MNEPDVTLTDFALAAEAALLAGLLLGRAKSAPSPRACFALFFASVSAATLCGGLVHGYFSDSAIGAALWKAALIAAGLATLAQWSAGAELLFAPRIVRSVRVAAAIQFIVYAAAVVFISQNFLIAVADNVPATLFLLVAFVVADRRLPNRRLLAGAAGTGLTLVSSTLQQLGIGLHTRYFNHNALYHLHQFVALVFIYVGAACAIDRLPPGASHGHPSPLP